MTTNDHQRNPTTRYPYFPRFLIAVAKQCWVSSVLETIEPCDFPLQRGWGWGD